MNYIKHQLSDRCLTIYYQKEGKNMALLLTPDDAAEIFYRAGVIRSSTRGEGFADTYINNRFTFTSFIDALKEPDFLSVIRYHELLSEYQQKGPDAMLAELTEQRKEIEANHARLNHLT